MSSAALPAGRANYTLAVLVAAYMLAIIDRQILSLLVEPIKRDLSISDFELSLLHGMSFAFFFVVFALPIARLSDNGSRRVIMAIGVSLWSLMTVACGLANSFGALLLARMGVGVGESTLSPAAYSILSDSFPPRRLPTAKAFYSMGAIVGGGLSFVVGGVVVGLVAVNEMVSLPIVGAVASWKAAFILVAIPGPLIAVLLLTITEPPRKGLLRDAENRAAVAVSTADVLRFVAKRWRSYGLIAGSLSALSVLAYSYLSWYPTYLIRTYGMTAGEAGLKLGLIYVILGPAGAYCGPKFGEVLRRSGHADANLRAVAFIALALLPLSLGLLMPTKTLALVGAAPMVFFLNAYFGLSTTSIQLITPNQMRALVSAMLLLVLTLVGLGFGPIIVALMTDHVFNNAASLNLSLTITSVLCSSIAAVTMMRALKHYRAALLEADRWNVLRDSSPTI